MCPKDLSPDLQANVGRNRQAPNLFGELSTSRRAYIGGWASFVEGLGLGCEEIREDG